MHMHNNNNNTVTSGFEREKGKRESDRLVCMVEQQHKQTYIKQTQQRRNTSV